MTIEVSLLLSGVSIAFAIFFGISTRNRNVKKDTQDEAREDAPCESTKSNRRFTDSTFLIDSPK